MQIGLYLYIVLLHWTHSVCVCSELSSRKQIFFLAYGMEIAVVSAFGSVCDKIIVPQLLMFVVVSQNLT